jgi:hypothetical protein
VPVLVALVAEPLNVLVDLGPERRGDHPPGALPREVVQRDLDLLVALRDGERANIRHRRAFLSRHEAVGLDQPGRYAAFLFTAAVHNIRL